jgi:hypothetical protein
MHNTQKERNNHRNSCSFIWYLKRESKTIDILLFLKSNIVFQEKNNGI